MVDRERVLHTFMELVAIDSPSGEEEAIAQEVGRRLSALGATVQRDAHGNLIARLAGDGAPFLLSAHMDTVQPGRGIRPLVDGDRIHTDGSTVLGGDPKAGIAAIIEGLTSLKEAGTRHRAVEVVLTRGEEMGLTGSRALDYDMVSAREGVVMDGEGAVNEITNEAPAQYIVDIAVTGRAAHAGVEPEKGISAIHIAAELILSLPQGRLDAETTANVGTITGGSARNAVSEHASFQAEFRSRNPQTLQAVLDTYDARIADAAMRHPDASIDVHMQYVFDGYQLAAEHPLIATCAAALATLGLTLDLKPSGGATDANIFAGHGITAAVLGLGGYHFHTVREELNITNLVNGARFIEAVLTTR